MSENNVECDKNKTLAASEKVVDLLIEEGLTPSEIIVALAATLGSYAQSSDDLGIMSDTCQALNATIKTVADSYFELVEMQRVQRLQDEVTG